MRDTAGNLSFMLVAALLIGLVSQDQESDIHIMVGEADSSSFVYQARLKREAWVKLVTEIEMSPWLKATEQNDFIAKYRLKGSLLSVQWRDEQERIHEEGPFGPYQSLPGKESDDDTIFAIVNGMNYHKYFNGPNTYEGEDKAQGYPALFAVYFKNPKFTVFMGDNVYYDHPNNERATTQQQLRQKWHEQFELPRMALFLKNMPTYWIKDDHDFRYNDSDRTGNREPSTELGIRTFREQVPVLGSGEIGSTYRTRRVTKSLQIWMVEGRDFRSPNNMPDGPNKTLWGNKQKQWLKNSLLASDAKWKILLTPTPMAGPDDGYKKDNHANIGGFQHEGEEFFKWAKENDLQNSLFVVCGDRHWQYHSVHPTGFHEFSAGAFIDANSRLGRAPGDPQSTDPDALVNQLFTQSKASGGFLLIQTSENGKNIIFELLDEHSASLYKFHLPK